MTRNAITGVTLYCNIAKIALSLCIVDESLTNGNLIRLELNGIRSHYTSQNEFSEKLFSSITNIPFLAKFATNDYIYMANGKYSNGEQQIIFNKMSFFSTYINIISNQQESYQQML